MRYSLSRRPRLALALAALAVCAAAASGPSAWPHASQDPQQPTFRTGTNFVRVDVYPMKDGRPVQGLTVGDFEVFEDGVRQRVETFEYVRTTPAGPHTARRDPSTQQEALQQAANPRSRVFVIFLDAPHVTIGGSYGIKEPLIRLIDQILGPEDLVAVMTPAMTTANLVLGRKRDVLEQQLRENWQWGTRAERRLDEREKAYDACYPPLPNESGPSSRLAMSLIARKRERATFEALQDLVRWLHGVRDERKAIITITEGWMRYRPAPELMTLRRYQNWQEPIPGPETIGVGPTGKLTTEPTRTHKDESLSKRECDTDRMRLANMDNEQFFREIVDDANRANATFYPVDPRGLPVFDSPIGPEAPPPPSVDRAMLRARLESLHDLALATDGIAILNSNDLDANLRRIGDDLTSYYLLGYYSTNTALDGKFRRLQVKVTQPGVNVRARRGYRAPTAEEVAFAQAEAEAVDAREPSALEEALERLARIPPRPRFTINASAHTAVSGTTTVWVAGEVPAGSPGQEPAPGGAADIEVRAGSETVSTRVSLEPGERTFVTLVSLDWKPADGAEDADLVEVRARLSATGSTMRSGAAVDVDAGHVATQPLVYRRGPSTGNKVLPAATFQFSRSERVRFDLPIAPGTNPGPARLLDKAGGPLLVPVKVDQRTDEQTGQHWLIAHVTLAPLAAGDYALELTTSSAGGTRQIVTAFRVTR